MTNSNLTVLVASVVLSVLAVLVVAILVALGGPAVLTTFVGSSVVFSVLVLAVLGGLKLFNIVGWLRGSAFLVVLKLFNILGVILVLSVFLNIIFWLSGDLVYGVMAHGIVGWFSGLAVYGGLGVFLALLVLPGITSR